MARNSEKAQSMLYRFRETQAIEMGLGNRQKGDRRPRMASSCTNLRESERWRGDILKEISRKVSKIQDANLSDYEVRDLNDEINSLMREKRHWETQIVNLGGANYKRGAASMTDEDGREVPGTRGYKYFGRARDLPGVREMFNKGAQQATEESARNASFQMFRNQGAEYYGDQDEVDPGLLGEEDQLAREDWEAAVAETAAALNLPETTTVPYPTPSGSGSSASTSAMAIDDPIDSSAAASASTSVSQPTVAAGKPKRKTRSGGKTAATAEAEREDQSQSQTQASGDAEEGGQAEEGGEGDAKKAKTTDTGAQAAPTTASALSNDPQAAAIAAQQAALASNFLGMLDPRSLQQPVMPTVEEMGKVLLEVRKNALRAEYGI